MKLRIALLAAAFMLVAAGPGDTLAERNEAMFDRLKSDLKLSNGQLEAVRAVFSKSQFIGQGNPKVTQHAMTIEACQEKAGDRLKPRADFEKICGKPFMAPLYNPATQKPEDAKACIDQYEFPSAPCTYPVVWVRASEAAEICSAMGKRLCDAHEWEGGCAGALLEPDYDFDVAKGKSVNERIRARRAAHNAKDKKVWAYGPEPKKGVCAMNSFKHDKCNGGNWQNCGSNTYPTGSFPDCKSSLEVYDLHGNAAEHMNLPLSPDEMSSRGSRNLGHTEMKGSWFIWDKFAAHQDQCRWRAPYWHGTRVMDKDSHHNYHLGFRCCSNVE